MKEYRVIEWSDELGAYLTVARRLTEEEKKSFAQCVWDRGFVGVSLESYIQLRHIRLCECPKRKDDGYFPSSGSSMVWILTPEEWDSYLALNAEREQAEKDAWAKELAELKASQAELYA